MYKRVFKNIPSHIKNVENNRKIAVFLDIYMILALRCIQIDLNIKDMDIRMKEKKLPAAAGLRFHQKRHFKR